MQTKNSQDMPTVSTPSFEIDVEALYRKFGPMVLRRCRAILRDEDTAQDAMQDVFVQLLRHKLRLDGRYPSSLLYRVATNTCLNILRKNRRRREISNEDLLGTLPGSGDIEAETLNRVTLEQVFSSEQEQTRRIALMRHEEGLSWEETAEQIGLSVSGARKRLRGLQRRGMALLSA